MKTKDTNLGIKLEIKHIWAIPATRDKWWKLWQKNVTLDELIKEMEQVGNKVVKIDRKNNRLGLAV
jgi:hypothetical protein